MTTLMSSSQLCGECHSSGVACYDYDSSCLSLSCISQVSDDGINREMCGSPGRHGCSRLREFQFFRHDDTVTRSLGPTHDVTPVVEPVIKYQETPHRDLLLTLDIFSSTTSSLDSPSGSCPTEVSIMEQASSSATAVSLLGSIENDTSTESVREADNTMTLCQGSNAAEREARILRYKEKKAVRIYKKQIRYTTRKTYAEMRPRVRGRFVKDLNSKSGQPTAPP